MKLDFSDGNYNYELFYLHLSLDFSLVSSSVKRSGRTTAVRVSRGLSER